MRTFSWTILAAVALAAPATLHAKDTTSTNKGNETYEVTSKDFEANKSLPKSATCDGDGKSPEIAWTAPKSSKAKSFALIVEDPDAPKGTYTHWVLFDIPKSTKELKSGVNDVGVSGTNSADKKGFAPACPPNGSGVHHYHFKVFALDVDKLGQKEGASKDDVTKAMTPHVIGEGDLVGTYERR